MVIGLTALVGLPLLIALVALAGRHWNPVLDLAMTELRVRDVGTRHTPLIGLPGRIGAFPDQGSHPGPLSFYLLAPTYRLLGSRSWSLEVGTVLIHLAAVAAGLTLAARRGGRTLCLATAVVFAVVLRGYGAGVLTQPWNPYLPVVAWVVVLIAAWSILEGDAVAMVVFVAAGSLCAQTHVPYVALVGGVGAIVFAVVVWRRLRHPTGVAEQRWRRWFLVAAGVGVVAWLPPVVDQVRRTPGNLSMLADYFRSPPERSIGVTAGLEHLLRHLDVTRLAGRALSGSGYFTSRSLQLHGSVVPGAVLVLAWAATAVAAWRLGRRALIHLHVVVGIGLTLAVIATARIFGKLWYYLTLWVWGLLVLCIVATIWTAAELVLVRHPRHRPRVEALTGRAAVVLLAASTAAFGWSALHVDPPENHLSRTLAAVVGPTAAALEAGVGAADGRTGSYVVTWSDAAYFGSQGYGLVNELERRGFHVGVPATWRVPVTPQRVLDGDDATAEIHLATGRFIGEWEAMPGVDEVASVDLRTPAEVALYVQLAERVTRDLHELGLDDLIPSLDTNLFGVQLDPRVPGDIQSLVNRMLLLGQPTAVFVAPPGTTR